MKWVITYHKNIEDDYNSVGRYAARRIMQAIDKKLAKSPLQFGEPLTGNLGAFRKLMVGDFRVVYQVVDTTVTVFFLAVGPRRDKEIYNAATKRI